MFNFNINPVLFNLGPFEIRYYGLMYVIGFILAYFIINHLSKKGMIKINKMQVQNLLVYSGIAGILGARLFYVLVYNLSYYLNNPIEIIKVWHGGLSFHGSLIGAVIGIYIFSRKYKFNFLSLLDILSIPFALGIALGRIGNFMNGELYGRITNLPWCVKFDEYCRHPSQLYESFYSFVIFGVLFLIKDKKMKKGMIFTMFLLLYSSFRFITEFFREPDSQIGFILGFTAGQWLCFAMFVFGLLLLYIIKYINGNKR